MAQHAENPAIERLAVFVGEWSMVAQFKDVPSADVGARVVFEWMPGRRFLIQRWEFPVPEAPNGIAIIGADPESERNFLQHYFDSRGVARVYKMSFVQAVAVAISAATRRAWPDAPCRSNSWWASSRWFRRSGPSA
jgi:hypothetical protein